MKYTDTQLLGDAEEPQAAAAASQGRSDHATLINNHYSITPLLCCASHMQVHYHTGHTETGLQEQDKPCSTTGQAMEGEGFT